MALGWMAPTSAFGSVVRNAYLTRALSVTVVDNLPAALRIADAVKPNPRALATMLRDEAEIGRLSLSTDRRKMRYIRDFWAPSTSQRPIAYNRSFSLSPHQRCPR
jgi:hypothetical protein